MKIQLSGLFNSKKYRQHNPDIGHVPALFHWIKFGITENRKHGLPPLSEWLLPHLIEGDITLKIVRKLQRVCGDPVKLGKYTTDLELNVNDYAYFKFLYRGAYNQAYDVLPQTSRNIFLNGAYYFAASHMRLEHLKAAYEAQVKTSLSLDLNRKKADIAQTLGYDSYKDIKAVIISLKSSRDAIADQIFRARLPVVYSDSFEPRGYMKSFDKYGLQSVSVKSPGRGGDFAKAVAQFETFINVATYNGIHSSPLCVTGTSLDAVKVMAFSDCSESKIKIRILMPSYWVFPQNENSVTGPVLSLQKSLIEKILLSGKAVVPVFATPIFDITDERNYGLNTLSYHTIVRKKMPNSYIHYKESYLPGYFTHDSHGYSGWSSLSYKQKDDFSGLQTSSKSFHNILYQKYCVDRLSKYTQDTATVNFPNRPFIFAALQVPDDTVTAWEYMSRKLWIATLCNFCSKTNIQIAIKVHPKDKNQATLDMLSMFPNIHISHANIHDLISESLAVITVNSGVGFEALLHHKPVITCGRSDYAAVTYNAKTPTELTMALQKISDLQNPTSPHEINHFLYAYLNDHCWTEETLNNSVLSTL